MLKKLRKNWIKQIVKINWRNKNKHNSTHASTIFNIDSVQVGNRSYGD